MMTEAEAKPEIVLLESALAQALDTVMEAYLDGYRCPDCGECHEVCNCE